MNRRGFLNLLAQLATIAGIRVPSLRLTYEEFKRNVVREFLGTPWSIACTGADPDGRRFVVTVADPATGRRRTRFYDSYGHFRYEVLNT